MTNLSGRFHDNAFASFSVTLLANKYLATQNLLQRKTSPAFRPKMFPVILRFISDLFWKFDENPLLHFFIILLMQSYVKSVWVWCEIYFWTMNLEWKHRSESYGKCSRGEVKFSKRILQRRRHSDRKSRYHFLLGHDNREVQKNTEILVRTSRKLHAIAALHDYCARALSQQSP